jgi:hypothetical protein
VAAEEREVDFVVCERARSAVSSVGKPGVAAPTVNVPKRDMRMHTSIKQAISCPLCGPQWWEAIANEWAGLQGKNCYKTVKLEEFMKPLLSFKVVFKVKFHADGTLDKFKVRLVVGGHKAIKGQHFYETFSPVLSIVVLRLILAIFPAYPHVVTTVADVAAYAQLALKLLDTSAGPWFYFGTPWVWACSACPCGIIRQVKSLSPASLGLYMLGTMDEGWRLQGYPGPVVQHVASDADDASGVHRRSMLCYMQ